MAVDPNIPVIAPPSSLDLAGGGGDQQVAAGGPADSGTQPGPQPEPGTAQWLADQPLDLNPFGEGSEGISRYDEGFVRRASDVIDRDLAKARRDADVSLAEHHSLRGTVGSSIESWSQQEMLTNLETERMRRLTNLETSMADAFAEDRRTAANLALAQRGQSLQAFGMDTQASQFMAQLGQQQSQFESSLDWQRDSLAQQLGFSREQLAQQNEHYMGMLNENRLNRMHQLTMQESEQGWMSAQNELDRLHQLGIQENDQRFIEAQNQLDRQQQQWLQENQHLFAREQSELDRLHELGIQENSFEFQQAENQLNRAQQTALQTQQQEWASTQNNLDRALESRALDLQKEGLDAETAWRQADRDLQIELTDRAEALQREGWEIEDSWRQAALDLDRESQAANEEIARWDIFLRALAGSAGSGVDIGQYFDAFMNGGGLPDEWPGSEPSDPSAPRYPDDLGTLGGDYKPTEGYPYDLGTLSNDYWNRYF